MDLLFRFVYYEKLGTLIDVMLTMGSEKENDSAEM
jgi:hypothetical protein